MCDLLSVLKNERQQCQYKHTENHKILECKIYHRHHLHSEEFRQCHPAVVRVNPIGYASWDTITWRAYTNQQRPMDLLLGCARNTVVLKHILTYKTKTYNEQAVKFAVVCFYLSNTFTLHLCHEYKPAAASATARPAHLQPFLPQCSDVHAPGSACPA